MVGKVEIPLNKCTTTHRCCSVDCFNDCWKLRGWEHQNDQLQYASYILHSNRNKMAKDSEFWTIYCPERPCNFHGTDRQNLSVSLWNLAVMTLVTLFIT